MEETQLLESIERLLRALDEHHITYCHWKSNEHLSEALNGDTDLDVLFEPTERSLLEQVFAECGLKRFRVTPLMQYAAIEDYIGFDQKEAKIWHVHTHYRMTLGEKHLKGYTVTPWGNVILRNRIRQQQVWTSNPSDELVLLYCRIALKLRWRDLGHLVGKDDQVELEWLKERVTDVSLAQSADCLVGEKSKEKILNLFHQELKKKNQLMALQMSLRKELVPYSFYNKFSSWITRTRRELFWFYGGVKRRLGWSNYSSNRRVSPTGGLVVAILGCDGAGKSTTLSYIMKEFSKKIDVASIYFGSGDGASSFLRKPMKLIAKRVGGKGVGHKMEQEYLGKKKVSIRARLYSLAKIVWAITLAKEKKSKQKKMIKARNNGLLVLTDRYPQNNIPGASDGPLLSRYRNGHGLLKKISEWENRIYESFSINAPDLVIKLVVPTDVAISRKPEMTAEEIENKKNIVMNMNISNHTTVIDTSRPFETTRGEVMGAIWRMI